MNQKSITIKQKVIEIIGDIGLTEIEKALLIIDIVEFYCIKRAVNLMTLDIYDMEYQ